MTITTAVKKNYSLGNLVGTAKQYLDVQTGRLRDAKQHREHVRAANKKHYSNVHRLLMNSATKEQSVLLKQYMYIYAKQGMRGVSNIALQTLERHIVTARDMLNEYEDYAHRALLSSLNAEVAFVPDAASVDYAKYGNAVHRQEYLALDYEIDFHANALRGFITHDRMVSVYECDHSTGYYAKLKETILRYTELQENTRQAAKNNSLLMDAVQSTMIFSADKNDLFARVVAY